MRRNILSAIIIFTVLPLAAAEVFFVPGWRTGYSSRAGCVRIMQDIWPDSKITVKSWNSDVSLDEAKQNAAEYAAQLKAELFAMPEVRRRELILVGHSLGAAIVLEILDDLAAQNLQLRETVLLAAPVPDDDPRIFRAIPAIKKHIYIVSFSGDGVLKLFYPWSAGKALGVSGWRFTHPKVVQLVTKPEFSLTNHFAYIYLETLADLRSSQPPAPVKIQIPGGASPYYHDETGIFWQTVGEFKSWKLQKHRVHDRFRIIDSKKRVRAAGSGDKLKSIFNSIRRQLSAPLKK